jgi:hypothetical protein
LQQKLEQVRRTTQLRACKEMPSTDRWLAVLGRLETQLPRQVGSNYANGFGHQNGAPAQLVGARQGFLRLKAKSRRAARHSNSAAITINTSNPINSHDARLPKLIVYPTPKRFSTIKAGSFGL